MAQLKTTFAGLTLNNPIIISSSGLTNSLAKIQKLEEAGAGAVRQLALRMRRSARDISPACTTAAAHRP